MRAPSGAGWLNDCSTPANNVGCYDRLGFSASRGRFAYVAFRPVNNGAASSVAWRRHLGCFAITGSHAA